MLFSGVAKLPADCVYIYNFYFYIFIWQLSPGGVLDEETVGRGLSNLGRSADGMHQVYLNVAIPVGISYCCAPNGILS